MDLPDTLAENIAARFAQLDRIEQTLGAMVDRLGKLEQKVSAFGEPAARTSAGAEERSARMEAAALASYRAAGAQTDDLVERLVDAIESLQSAAPEQTEGSAAGVN